MGLAQKYANLPPTQISQQNLNQAAAQQQQDQEQFEFINNLPAHYNNYN